MSNELEIIRDYADAGFRVFPLWGIEAGGTCECGDPECAAVGKHPRTGSWQHTPQWSEEQLDAMLEYTISTGFGVALDPHHLVVDVDPRNGGFESLAALNAELCIDLLATSSFVVKTGGGGWHIYFTIPAGTAIQAHLAAYPGIDFKSGAAGGSFLVGCGSLHKSGALYDREKGWPGDTSPAPQQLIDLLRRTEAHRTAFNGSAVDVTDDELRSIVSHIPNNDADYETFITVGMGIENATGGSQDGYAMWVDWAAQSSKYDPKDMPKKWASFGKCANPVTIGSLVYMAEQNGWCRSITFEVADVVPQVATTVQPDALPIDTSWCDLQSPPGFVGDVVRWINSQCRYPRERIAVMVALTAIGNIGGLKYTDDITGAVGNLLSLCVAGSGTGKEAPQQAFAQLLRAAGLGGAICGDLKSKQEIVRNLLEHQAAYYATDEIGEILRGIENARKKGGAAYLEGIPGQIMSVTTKAADYLPVSGDVRRDTIKGLAASIAQCRKAVENNEDPTGLMQRRADSLTNLLMLVEREGGIPRPFLSLIGFTTMESFEPCISVEIAKNGFLNRAFVIEERDTNPKPNKKYKRGDLPEEIARVLMGIAATGESDTAGRIEYYGERIKIPTEPKAVEALNKLMEWQWAYAEWHKEHTGFEALVRRSVEQISKLSHILSMASRLRTVEHVAWAAAFVKRDIDEKIRLIQFAQSKEAHEPSDLVDGLAARILSICADDGAYQSAVLQRVKRKGVTREQVATVIEKLVAAGKLAREGRRLIAQ